jgi:hypothetical protein
LEPGKDTSSPAQKSSSLLGLLGILASVFGVWVFSKLRAPVHDTERLRHPEYGTNKETRVGQNPSAAPLSVVIDSIPPAQPINDQQKVEAAKKEKRERLKLRYEAIGGAIALLLFVANWFQGCQTKKAADAAIEQFKAYSGKENRAWIWVNMGRIHVEVGKPITADVEVFNYGKVPAVVRARIRVEVAPGAIESFRKEAIDNAKTAMVIEDAKGLLKIVLPANEGYRDFPVESPQQILTRQDYNRIMNGVASNALDVVVYGRIFYASPGMPLKKQENNDIFCFYLLKNGTTSTCTNQDGAYTNWID